MYENNENILNVSESTESTGNDVFAQVSRTLAGRYEVIYYVDTVTNEYQVYSASKEFTELGMTSFGSDFFSDLKKDVKRFIHPEDRNVVLKTLEKSSLLESIRESGILSLSYRQILEGRQQYVGLLCMSAHGDSSHIVIGVANTDAEMKLKKNYRRGEQKIQRYCDSTGFKV
ncbi:hypothetical protein [Ruminococcus sp. HUN007]|uniref:hypothetical protein n=1 Tax=Ruminococcus sp. HUN007 TaxID=1514668 RepID=UPI0005D1CBCD|nr:hypothetical protein [Ruminococcus sp. HUN007]